MSKILNTAVIGLGNMGRHHVRNYSELPIANLVAVCDANPTLAKDFSEKYNVPFYTSVTDLFQNESIDAVSIAAPTSYHFDIAKEVIENGCHLLIEKPIADTVENAQKLNDLAEEKGVVLAVGHIERFNPVILKAKELIDAGEIGKITACSSKRVGMFPPQIKDANVIIDLAVHDIDIVTHLLGKLPDTVTGNSGRALIDSREDYADLFLTYGDQSALIQVNWITPLRIRTLSITGSKGYIDLDYLTQSLTLTKSDYKKDVDKNGAESVQFTPTEPQKISVESGESLANELTHFLTCITENKTPTISGKVGQDALEIALDILKL